MSVTVKWPVLVDAELLRAGLETARRSNSDLKIETFYRLTIDGHQMDCDTQQELFALVVGEGLHADDGTSHG